MRWDRSAVNRKEGKRRLDGTGDRERGKKQGRKGKGKILVR